MKCRTFLDADVAINVCLIVLRQIQEIPDCYMMPPPMKRKLGEPSELFNMRGWFVAQISTAEETFQSHIIDSTIFQTNSFDVLSEFALLISCATSSAYFAVLSHESDKMSKQKRKILISSK